jgi:hypothetical protein
LSVLRHELPHMSQPERHAALLLAGEALVNERAINRAHEAVCLDAVELIGPTPGAGGGSCGISLRQIRTGHDLATEGGAGRPTAISALVPDGVATITLGFRATGGGMRKLTTRPVGNVMVVRAPRGAAAAVPATIVWHDATGRVLRRIDER